jgi:hypothetical protein
LSLRRLNLPKTVLNPIHRNYIPMYWLKLKRKAAE